MKKLLLSTVVLLSLVSNTSVAQTENEKTFSTEKDSIGDASQLRHTVPDLLERPLTAPRPYKLADPLTLDKEVETRVLRPVPSMNMTYPSFRLWKGADLSVTGYSSELPGLAMASTGALSLSQNFGNVRLTAAALVHKQWMPTMGLNTMYGIGGAAAWQLNDNISLHTFGSYYPGMMGFYTAGGYMDIRFSDHWGAELGAYYTRNTFTRQQKLSPIVTPYYRFNDGTKLSLPVGPLVEWGLGELGRAVRRW